MAAPAIVPASSLMRLRGVGLVLSPFSGTAILARQDTAIEWLRAEPWPGLAEYQRALNALRSEAVAALFRHYPTALTNEGLRFLSAPETREAGALSGTGLSEAAQ